MPIPRLIRRTAAFALVGLALGLAVPAAAQNRVPEVPYVATPYDAVQTMLRTAGVGSGDVVLDLGSGDGRIVIAAVRDFGAERGIGVDINPLRVREGRRNAAADGVDARTAFIEGNVLDASLDLGRASVVTLYLLPEINLRLRPRLLAELKPGSRIVSYAFRMGDWRPDRTAKTSAHDVHLWVVPARVRGTWRLQAGDVAYELQLRQDFQQVTGRLAQGGAAVPIADARLVGAHLRFRADLSGRSLRFDARVVAADRMDGTLDLDGRRVPTTAQRTP